MPDVKEINTTKIRQLNDQFRKTLKGGKLVLTRGIAGREDVWAIIAKVASFKAFDDANDPYRERDFGAFEMNGDSIFFKIDYYDPDMTGGSRDPSDPALTTRVLTIMRADEY